MDYLHLPDYKGNPPPESKTTISVKKWSSLFTPDMESCCLSYIMPCHVIGKVSKRLNKSYSAFFLLYLFLTICYYISAEQLITIVHMICPNKKTSYCFQQLTHDTCTNHYMLIGDDNVGCYYDYDYSICYAGDKTCIPKEKYNTALWVNFIIGSFAIGSMYTIHIYLRITLQRYQTVPKSLMKNICSVMWCNTCSLAQMYREKQNTFFF